MNIVLLLIPLGIVLVAAAAAALIWAVDSGQYDGDMEEKGRMILEADEAAVTAPGPDDKLVSRAETSRPNSEFLAKMSHELRTPLNGMLGFTEFVLSEKPGPLNEKQKEYLRDVLNSGRQLLQLINDVVDPRRGSGSR